MHCNKEGNEKQAHWIIKLYLRRKKNCAHQLRVEYFIKICQAECAIWWDFSFTTYQSLYYYIFFDFSKQRAHSHIYNMHVTVWYSNWLIAIFNFPTMPTHKIGYRHIDSYIQHSFVLSLRFWLRQFQLFFYMLLYLLP